MRSWIRSVLGWAGLGLAVGLALAAWDALAVERDLRLGLRWLAAERALATSALLAGAGALAGVGALLAGGVVRALGAPPRPARALALASGALPIAAAAAAVLRFGIPDARVPALVTGLRAPRAPNVLVVVLDTVRADRLSSYGHPRPTTPELDAFARDAIRYPRFWSTAPWTLPGHASLFTGLYPMRHGATQEHLVLAPRFATLAEALRDAGFATFAASANPIVSEAAGLDQGFARFVEAWRDEGGAAHPVTGAFERFLAGQGRERPFFAFLNYMEAHSPYTPPASLRARFAPPGTSAMKADRIGRRRWFEHYLDGPWPPAELALLSDLYDAELAQLSAEIGRLLEALRRDGRFDETVIVVTSDHGEHFGEHGLVEHMFSVYEPVLHVPLLLRLPGGARAGEVDERLGQLVDLPPALLRLCGVDPAPLAAQGVDLLAPAPQRHEVLAEYYFPNQVLSLLSPEELARAAPRLAPHLRRLRALAAEDGRKLIAGSDGRRESYDLAADPGETRDLLAAPAPGAAQAADALAARLAALVEQGAAPAALAPPRPDARVAGLDAAVDADTAARLRELGYLR